MRRSTQVALGCAVAVLLLFGGGAVALVKTGAVDAMLNQCTGEATRSAEQLADAVRQDLPGRTSDVEVVGYCDKQPWPAVTTRTESDRATIARELRTRWGCSVHLPYDPYDNGVVLPSWECLDVAGHQAIVDVERDGDFRAELF